MSCPSSPQRWVRNRLPHSLYLGNREVVTFISKYWKRIIDSWWYPRLYNLIVTVLKSRASETSPQGTVTFLPRIFRRRSLPVHRWNTKRWLTWSKQLTVTVVLYFLIRISALLPSLIGCRYFARSLAFFPRDYEQTTKYNVHAFQRRLSRLE